MFGEQAVDFRAGLRVEVTKQNILQRRQAYRGLNLLDNLPQPGAETQAARILDPAVFHAQTVVPLAVALRVPAQMRFKAADFNRPRRRERALTIAPENSTDMVD